MGSLASTFAQVLPSLHRRVFDYANADDFQRLWAFRDIPSDQLVILWSDTARDKELWPINAAECVSPVDWAISYTSRYRDSPETWPEVLVLDLSPLAHRGVSSVAHFQTLKPDQLPWLQIQAGVSLASLLRALGDKAPRERVSCQAAVDRFLREIRLNLSEVKQDGDYDRHSISNVIGPMVLRGKAAKTSLHSAALLELLRACKLLPQSAETATSSGEVASNQTGRSGDESKEKETGVGLHILLVDDQAGHGWADWVKESLPDAEITVETNPTVLAEAVRQQLKDAGTRDLRFRLRLPGVKEGKQPILLLDLRLFSGKPDAERTFYRDHLLPLVKHFMDREDAAWPTFSSGKLDSTIQAVSSGTLELESPAHHEVLTWLPRILALADLSLPIVLFSSAGRRTIARTLASQGNVILGFEKPRFFEAVSAQDAGDLPGSTRTALFRAIDEAKTILKGRTRARQSLQCSSQLVATQVSERYGHFELFIDESGRGKNLVVGGLIACFASAKDAQDFDDRLVQAGVRYFPTLAGPAPAGQPLEKDQSCKQEFEHVVSEWRNEKRALHLSLLSLDGIEPFTASLRFLDMDFMDNRWRLAVEAVVELFVSEVVARLQVEGSENESASVAIYGPTRVSPAASEDEATMNMARFGTPVQRLEQLQKPGQPPPPPNWGNNAVAESNLFHLACNILRNHCMTVNLDRAKFIRLQYVPRGVCREWELPGSNLACLVRGANRSDDETQLRRLQPDLTLWRAGLRALHYVCDQVLRDMIWNDGTWATLSASAPTFHESYGRVLRGNLAASRFLDTKRPIEAMVAWQPNGKPQPQWRRGVRKATEAIGARLAVALDTISGTAFMEGSQRLKMRTAMSVPVPTVRTANARAADSAEELGVKQAPSGEEPTGIAEVGKVSAVTRYFVLVENLPSAITAQGLLQAANWGAYSPVSCEIAEDAEEERNIAAIYFEDEAAPFQVAQSMRRRGWQAKPFVAAQVQTAPSFADNASDLSEPPPVEASDRGESVAMQYRLRVGPIHADMPPEKVISRLKEEYPSIRSIERLWPARGSTKYLLECAWPLSTALPRSPGELLCGHDCIPVEIIALHEAEP